MKNTAPPRALRGQGLTGAAPPMVSGRGGCGRHEPPQKDGIRRAIGDTGRRANPARLRAGGNLRTAPPQICAQAEKQARARPAGGARGSEATEQAPRGARPIPHCRAKRERPTGAGGEAGHGGAMATPRHAERETTKSPLAGADGSDQPDAAKGRE